MNEKEKKWLIDAFQNATLAALYVDLQTGFKRDFSEKTFQINRDLSNTLRSKDVQNLWIAMTMTGLAWKRYKASKFNNLRSLSARHKLIVVEPGRSEFVYTKDVPNAFFNPKAELINDIKSYTTLIISGVFPHKEQCVPESIIGALRSSNANIIIVLDGIGAHKPHDILEMVLINCKEEEIENFRSRIAVSNSNEILTLLDATQPHSLSHHKVGSRHLQ